MICIKIYDMYMNMMILMMMASLGPPSPPHAHRLGHGGHLPPRFRPAVALLRHRRPEALELRGLMNIACARRIYTTI